jgi:hypothetical protein
MTWFTQMPLKHFSYVNFCQFFVNERVFDLEYCLYLFSNFDRNPLKNAFTNSSTDFFHYVQNWQSSIINIFFKKFNFDFKCGNFKFCLKPVLASDVLQPF